MAPAVTVHELWVSYFFQEDAVVEGSRCAKARSRLETSFPKGHRRLADHGHFVQILLLRTGSLYTSVARNTER